MNQYISVCVAGSAINFSHLSSTTETHWLVAAGDTVENDIRLVGQQQSDVVSYCDTVVVDPVACLMSNHRSVLNILDSLLGSHTPAEGVVTIVCRVEIRKMVEC